MRAERVVAIDVSDLARRAHRWAGSEVGTVTVEAGFASFRLVTVDAERAAAWPLVARLQDKRVFSADDCCHNCVKNSIASLLEVRTTIIDAKAGLADHRDGQLVWVLDWMTAVIRAFLTWEERARVTDDGVRDPAEHYRSMDRTRHTIDQLDVVRAHLRVALAALASMAGLDVPAMTSARLPDLRKVVADPRYVLSVNEGKC